jgi:hypothetical protein
MLEGVGFIQDFGGSHEEECKVRIVVDFARITQRRRTATTVLGAQASRLPVANSGTRLARRASKVEVQLLIHTGLQPGGGRREKIGGTVLTVSSCSKGCEAVERRLVTFLGGRRNR